MSLVSLAPHLGCATPALGGSVAKRPLVGTLTETTLAAKVAKQKTEALLQVRQPCTWAVAAPYGPGWLHRSGPAVAVWSDALKRPVPPASRQVTSRCDPEHSFGVVLGLEKSMAGRVLLLSALCVSMMPVEAWPISAANPAPNQEKRGSHAPPRAPIATLMHDTLHPCPTLCVRLPRAASVSQGPWCDFVASLLWHGTCTAGTSCFGGEDPNRTASRSLARMHHGKTWPADLRTHPLACDREGTSQQSAAATARHHKKFRTQKHPHAAVIVLFESPSSPRRLLHPGEPLRGAVWCASRSLRQPGTVSFFAAPGATWHAPPSPARSPSLPILELFLLSPLSRAASQEVAVLEAGAHRQLLLWRWPQLRLQAMRKQLPWPGFRLNSDSWLLRGILVKKPWSN